MLDAVTNKKNSLLLDSLAKRNIFTTKTKGEQFRYHTLFRKHLLKDMKASQQKQFEHKAGSYYYELKQYSQAAKYAMLAKDKELLEKIILAGYEDHIKNGSFSEMRNWFKALGGTPATSNQKISLVRGIFLRDFLFGFSLYIATTGSHVPYKSLKQVHAASMPAAAWIVSRFHPDLSRINRRNPVLTTSANVSTPRQRFALTDRNLLFRWLNTIIKF